MEGGVFIAMGKVGRGGGRGGEHLEVSSGQAPSGRQ